MEINLKRWVSLSGAVTAILILVSIFLTAVPDSEDSNQEVLNWYADSGNRISALISGYLFVIAAIFLLAFVSRLRGALREAEGNEDLFANGAFAGGIGAAICLVGAATALAAVPGGIEFGDEPLPQTSDVPRYLNSLGIGLFLIGSAFSALLMILVTAVASFRYAIFPAWFNWLSVLCVIALIFAVIWVPYIALLLWLLVASVLLFKKEPGEIISAE